MTKRRDAYSPPFQFSSFRVMAEFTSVSSPQHSETLSESEASPQNNTTKFKNAYITHSKHVKSRMVRGRKTFAFWTLVVLLFLLAVGNLILTMTILGVLRLGHGMQSIEILPEEKSVKLFGAIDFDKIYKQNGVLEGYKGENLEIIGNEGSLYFNLYSRFNRIINKIKMERNNTSFNSMSSFIVKNKENISLFNINQPEYNNLKNVNNLKAKIVSTSKIRSKIDENLKIEGDILHLKGNEGTKIEAREILWSADQDIYLKSINGSIILSGKEGTYVDVERLPLARLSKSSYTTAQFKICVCMPQGKLFRVPVANVNVPVYCYQVNMSTENNPCM